MIIIFIFLNNYNEGAKFEKIGINSYDRIEIYSKGEGEYIISGTKNIKKYDVTNNEELTDAVLNDYYGALTNGGVYYQGEKMPYKAASVTVDIEIGIGITYVIDNDGFVHYYSDGIDHKKQLRLVLFLKMNMETAAFYMKIM